MDIMFVCFVPSFVLNERFSLWPFIVLLFVYISKEGRDVMTWSFLYITWPCRSTCFCSTVCSTQFFWLNSIRRCYSNHCEEDDSKCADHCRVFALSHAGDTDVQKVCSHSHNVKCEDCEKLKSVLEEVKGAISECTMQLGRFQAEDYLYEASRMVSQEGNQLACE